MRVVTGEPNTTITLCPACGEVLFTEHPPEIERRGPGTYVMHTSSPRAKELYVRQHYTERHRLRWWIANRWPRVLKWALTFRVRASW